MACRWSTGPSKKPWAWAVCRSTVTIRSAPAVLNMSAIRRADTGSRPAYLRSWRAYGYEGTTAVMRLAEARLRASTTSSCSTSQSLTGAPWLCRTNASAPRTDSSKRTKISPFAKS